MPGASRPAWPWKWERSLTDYVPSRGTFKDLTGIRSGGLVALYPLGYKNGNCQWMFQCDCGRQVAMFTSGFLQGRAKSCGCASTDRRLETTAAKACAKGKWDKTKTEFKPKGSNFRDETGNSYGRLTALYPTRIQPGRRDNYTMWMWRCSCGKEIEASSYDVHRGHIVSCGCSRYGTSAANWSGYEDMPGKFLSRLPITAANRGYEYRLTKEFLWELFIKQGMKCALSGRPIQFLDSEGKIDLTASLDRIDSSSHYTEDNVQWVHKTINLMKNALGQADFISFCADVAKHAKDHERNGI